MCKLWLQASHRMSSERRARQSVIAARRKLVEGAVSMVEMALAELGEKSLVTFTPSHKVKLVTNLMSVLVSETHTQPVLQIGASEA
jgi:hypothetical protein